MWLASSESGRRLRELGVVEQRSLMLLAALRSFYVSLASFASATLVSLLGAVLVPMDAGVLVLVLEIVAMIAGLIAVSALVYGSSVLVRETRLLVQVLQERVASVHARAVPRGDPTA